mmetsp:Transcript_27334/g.81597  ORF Transcript_27334/g.81597 Transcript_27334/m.81597 type:complete len:450 (-) Transcript_27334:1141-2490(-)
MLAVLGQDVRLRLVPGHPNGVRPRRVLFVHEARQGQQQLNHRALQIKRLSRRAILGQDCPVALVSPHRDLKLIARGVVIRHAESRQPFLPHLVSLSLAHANGRLVVSLDLVTHLGLVLEVDDRVAHGVCKQRKGDHHVNQDDRLHERDALHVVWESKERRVEHGTRRDQRQANHLEPRVDRQNRRQHQEEGVRHRRDEDLVHGGDGVAPHLELKDDAKAIVWVEPHRRRVDRPGIRTVHIIMTVFERVVFREGDVQEGPLEKRLVHVVRVVRQPQLEAHNLFVEGVLEEVPRRRLGRLDGDLVLQVQLLWPWAAPRRARCRHLDTAVGACLGPSGSMAHREVLSVRVRHLVGRVFVGLWPPPLGSIHLLPARRHAVTMEVERDGARMNGRAVRPRHLVLHAEGKLVERHMRERLDVDVVDVQHQRVRLDETLADGGRLRSIPQLHPRWD